MQDFISWLETKNYTENGTIFNEISFMEPPQNVGDLVFFGIHLLNRLYSELNEFPFLSLGTNPERTDISQYISKISEVDPARRTVVTKPDRSPFAMGYRSRDINKKDRQGQVHIPAKQLEDVTFLLPVNDQSTKLWVVITNNYQRNLANSLRKREFANRNSQKAAPQPVMQPRPQRELPMAQYSSPTMS